MLQAKIKGRRLSLRLHRRYRLIAEGASPCPVPPSGFSAWTIPKLAEYCRQRGVLPQITDEWVRRLLRREGLRAQRIRTWKTSDDPVFDREKNASTNSNGPARHACGPRITGARAPSSFSASTTSMPTA
jgi:hypothetical protein